MNKKNLVQKIFFGLVDFAKDSLRVIIKSYMFVCYKVFGLSNSVVFSSFRGMSYSDNPRAISEKLHEIHPEMQIYWIFSNVAEKRTIVPSYIKRLRNISFKSLKIQATSKFWVDNSKKPSYIYKNKDQIYIQTWHGDKAFKKVLYDNPYYPIELNLLEETKANLILSGSKYGENQIRSAFRYKGEILKVGCPRNDALLAINSEKQIKIKKINNLPLNANILLFAPTFRDTSNRENNYQDSDINLKEILSVLSSVTSQKWIGIIRAHYFTDGIANIIPNNNLIFDGNKLEDMKDLLLITDILITDYSSTAGDFALTKKPVILYQPDIEEYIKNDRTLYFDIKDSPYITAQTNNQLIDIFKSIDFKNMKKNSEEILKFYGSYETGKASEAVVNYITNNLKSL
ncbi:MAG: CDP-glycerol glycerophosphotransferase family protein [Bacilli bacterium]|nr:CDP-glycerol glycerophosphotransferase family protein [Bacilli bacterium]